MATVDIEIDIPEKFIDYIEDWNYEEYFNYGGYGSGKSDATAFKLLKISFEEKRLILVTRKVYNTLADSCYRLIKQVAERYKMSMFLEFRRSPLSIKNTITGTEFIFRGLDRKNCSV